MQLVGRSSLVTGGGTGVGFGCAQRLLEHGAEVLIVGRRDDVLEDAIGRLKAIVPEGKVSFQVCDITVEEEVVAAVEAAAGEGGLVWSPETFAPYFADPRGAVKGTKMAFPGLKKESEIADVIAYLATFSPTSTSTPSCFR